MHTLELRRRLNKPYFLFRPRQALLRLRSPLAGDAEFAEVELPWGLPLRLRRHEQTGVAVLRRGLFDLTVSETLFRLTESGETAVDVGANVGHMSSVLAHRVGTEGEVIAIEPHPRLHAELAANVSRWAQRRDAPRFTLHRIALSDRSGVGRLVMESGFDWNQGSARLGGEAEADVRSERVEVRRLDELLGNRRIGVMKVDVEGHELEVFRGAERALGERRIRDIVFEDFGAPPTAVTRHLERSGYTVFSLDQALLGPLVGPAYRRAGQLSGDDPSYLATAAPVRARARLRPRGWAALGVLPRRSR